VNERTGPKKFAFRIVATWDDHTGLSPVTIDGDISTLGQTLQRFV